MDDLLQLHQQTKRDLMLRCTSPECAELLAGLHQVRTHAIYRTRIDAHASMLRVRSPRVVQLDLVLADHDSLRREPDSIIWQLEPETADELAERFERALAENSFVPAELTLLKGPNGDWVRLYAELVQ